MNFLFVFLLVKNFKISQYYGTKAIFMLEIWIYFTFLCLVFLIDLLADPYYLKE